MPEPPAQPDAQTLADKALADCGGDEAATRLLLAHLLINARQGMSTDHLRLGANATTR